MSKFPESATSRLAILSPGSEKTGEGCKKNINKVRRMHGSPPIPPGRAGDKILRGAGTPASSLIAAVRVHSRNLARRPKTDAFPRGHWSATPARLSPEGAAGGRFSSWYLRDYRSKLLWYSGSRSCAHGIRRAGRGRHPGDSAALGILPLVPGPGLDPASIPVLFLIFAIGAFPYAGDDQCPEHQLRMARAQIYNTACASKPVVHPVPGWLSQCRLPLLVICGGGDIEIVELAHPRLIPVDRG